MIYVNLATITLIILMLLEIDSKGGFDNPMRDTVFDGNRRGA